jgi:hypothetical protein
MTKPHDIFSGLGAADAAPAAPAATDGDRDILDEGEGVEGEDNKKEPPKAVAGDVGDDKVEVAVNAEDDNASSIKPENETIIDSVTITATGASSINSIDAAKAVEQITNEETALEEGASKLNITANSVASTSSASSTNGDHKKVAVREGVKEDEEEAELIKQLQRAECIVESLNGIKVRTLVRIVCVPIVPGVSYPFAFLKLKTYH